MNNFIQMVYHCIRSLNFPKNNSQYNKLDYKPEYSSIELAVDEMSLEPSSKTRPRLFMKPGGNEPGPDGDGKWRLDCPTPGDGARRGGVARPNPESVSTLHYVKIVRES